MRTVTGAIHVDRHAIDVAHKNFRFTRPQKNGDGGRLNNIASRIWAACAANMLIGTDRANGTATSSVTKTRVLLIHGIADSAASMRILQKRLARDGRKSLAITLKPGDGSVSLEALSLQLRDYVRDRFSADERFDLVGFSMGGLICRYYVQLLGGHSRVDRLITISSPNRGTLLAFLNSRVGAKKCAREVLFCKSLTTIAQRCATSMLPRFGRPWI